MAIYTQPQGGDALQTDGNVIRTLVRKGPYADVLAEAQARPRGALVPDVGYVIQWTINRNPGGLGTVTYTCADVTAEQYTSNSALADVWSLRNTQTTLPLSVYCGPSQGANAQWRRIQQWRQERDNTLYSQYKYRVGSTEYTLPQPEQRIASKIIIGIEQVQRHYPVVQRQRTYAREPDDGIGALLDYIDAPAKWASAAPTWLKVQDDVSQASSGAWTRTEQWLGAEVLDNNLYGTGTARWAFGSI